jgi:hypothetical protein
LLFKREKTGYFIIFLIFLFFKPFVLAATGIKNVNKILNYLLFKIEVK